MTNKLISLLLLFSLVNVSYGQDLIERTQHEINIKPISPQTQTRIYTDINQQRNSSNSDIHYLFTFDKTQSKRSTHETELSKAPVYLELNVDQLQTLNTDKAENIQLAIPVDDKNHLMLTLREFNCLSESFDAITNTGQHLDFSTIRTFRGYVDNDPSSTVSMTLANGQLKLLISDNQGNYSLGQFNNKEAQYVLLNDSSHKQQNEFICGAKTTSYQGQNFNKIGTHKSSSASVGCIDIYMEIDHDLYLSNGTTESSVFNGIALFNEVATIYSNENIDINISNLKVWTTADPYANMTNIDNVLDAFGDNMKNNFNGDLAHLLKANQIGGGVAWLDQLGVPYCSNCGEGGSSTGPYAISSGISSSVIQYPAFSWNVMVIAHELGHNFGSPHTHDCFWNGNNTAIDGCATPSSCSNPGLPAGGGTIMSYCHQQPSTGINLASGFGSQPGNLIRSRTSNVINNNLVDGTCSCSVPCVDDFVLDYFGSIYGSRWSYQSPRVFGDVNGDGMDDIIGFASAGLRVALSNGTDLILNSVWSLAQFGLSNGWNSDVHPRFVVDVNGDGMDDIVGFASSGVFVTTSTGSSFTTPSYWINGYGSASNLDINDNPRIPGDFNNDGITDFVVFGNTKTAVIESTGTAFVNNVAFDLDHYHSNQNWNSLYPRLVGDVDGDGFDDDIVGFGPNAVKVSKSNGNSFTTDNIWTTQFTAASAGWTPVHHPRFLADVNGDGMDDIVGIANGGVNVGLSTGTSFGPRTLWYPGFGSSSGWTVANHPRFMTDINGDGMADIIGFANQGVYMSLSNGSGFDAHELIVGCYGFHDGWSSPNYVRKFADLTGDGQKEIVAMGCGGTYVHFPAIENNDQCVFAEEIIVNTSCNPSSYSNIGYTPSGEQPPFVCGSAGTTIDAWFTVEVPPSGNVTIETIQVTGGLTDMVMQVLIGSCGAFTTVFCDDDDGSGNHSLFNLIDQTPGEIVYIRIIEYGSNEEGEFGICAYDESGISCPPNYDGLNQLTGTQSTVANYESNGTITSDQVIDANTEYNSGSELNLIVGFEVKMGKLFHAFIDGCEGSQ